MKHFINLKDIPAKDLRRILIDAKNKKQLTNPKLLGRVKRLEDGSKKYIEILKTTGGGNESSDTSSGYTIPCECKSFLRRNT